MVGIYAVLAASPIWVTALTLYLLTEGMMYVGRDRLEGIPYQVSYSAKLGDAGLMAAVLIAATILQRGRIIIPVWLQDEGTHLVILIISAGIGGLISLAPLGKRSGQLMDVYHDIVIGPIILYFAITLLPIIYLNGTPLEQVTTMAAIVFWAILVLYDVMTGRLDQRSWLKARGVIFNW